MISNKKIIRDKNSIISYCAYLTENFDRKEGLESFIEDGKLVLELLDRIIELSKMKHLKSTDILIREAIKAQRVV